MTDEQFFLANAYIDGELTNEERRIAEADPAVMAEVAELRAVQASIQAVEPPSDESREAAIGAAMAEFGQHAAPAPTTVVPFTPRPAYSKYLTVAAAAVGVGLLATVIVVGTRGGGDDDSSADSATAAAEEPASEPGDEPADEPADEAASEAAEDGGAFTESFDADGDADTAAADEAADEPAADEPASAEVESSLSDDATDDEEASTSTAPAPERVLITLGDPIVSDVELSSYGAELIDLQTAGELGSTPNTACPPEFDILDEATLLDGEVDIAIYVGVDTSGRMVFAIDKESCEVLLEAPLAELGTQP